MSTVMDNFVIQGADILDLLPSVWSDDIHRILDDFDPAYNFNMKPGDMAVVSDHMCGDFFVVGKLISYTSEGDGWSKSLCVKGVSWVDRVDIRDFILDNFGLEVPQIQTLVLTRWR